MGAPPEAAPLGDQRRSGLSAQEFHTPGFLKSGTEPEQTPEELEFLKKQAAEDELEKTKPLSASDGSAGTVLEAAFVDAAYSWPPMDGEGKNAIELQASIDLLHRDDDVSVGTTASMRERMKVPPKPEKIKKKRWWQCCAGRDEEALEQVREYEERKMAAKEARQAYAQLKREKKRQKENTLRQKERYSRVPEGILIYRLDTSRQELELVSPPHAKTDRSTLIHQLKIKGAKASSDKSRRGLILIDEEGDEHLLVACEQRTAIAWLEAMHIMIAKQPEGFLGRQNKSSWSKERLESGQLETIEEQYLNLANYSNKLIRAGALPGGKKGRGGAGGIYYSVEKVVVEGDEEAEEEALEAIAKRRAVIKDSWDFYRMICSLLRDRHKYDEVFRRMQLDAVYPYLNSMTGLNDTNQGYENLDKEVIQTDLPEYDNMTRTQVARALCQQAQDVLPSLVEICKALAGSLGMEEVGVGPIKEVTAALRKAEKKYNGDILKVTDFCRALLVVKDFPSLLALLELARDSFGPLIRRVKMSTLKADYAAKPGGYRDVIINVELKGHICEIQVHLWPLWVICGVDGFRHYRHCLEYATDSFEDAYDALDGLDRKTMAELIVMAEEAVAETPLDNLEWYHEKYILDYFAEAGLFMKHDLYVWAEVTFRQLIRLRTESPDMGPQHYETISLYKYLIRALQAQGGKHAEAQQLQERVRLYEKARSKEFTDAEKSLWDTFLSTTNEAYDYLMDPNRKEREQEERMRKEVKASKRAWRQVRAERFSFLDAATDESAISPMPYEEKKNGH